MYSLCTDKGYNNGNGCKDFISHVKEQSNEKSHCLFDKWNFFGKQKQIHLSQSGWSESCRWQ